jgi:hypothetical protein
MRPANRCEAPPSVASLSAEGSLQTTARSQVRYRTNGFHVPDLDRRPVVAKGKFEDFAISPGSGKNPSLVPLQVAESKGAITGN